MSDQGEGTDLAALRDEIAELAVRAERFEVERDAARAERDRAVEAKESIKAAVGRAETRELEALAQIDELTAEAATLKGKLAEAEGALSAVVDELNATKR